MELLDSLASLAALEQVNLVALLILAGICQGIVDPAQRSTVNTIRMVMVSVFAGVVAAPLLRENTGLGKNSILAATLGIAFISRHILRFVDRFFAALLSDPEKVANMFWEILRKRTEK